MKRWPWEEEDADAALAKAKRKNTARRSQRMGVVGEAMAAARLRSLGALMVHRQHTGTAMIGGKRRFTASVHGDLSAVIPGGRHLHCESKYRAGNLSISDFETHQLAALNDYHAAGALALVGWSCPHGVVLLAWPVPGLAHGHRLTWAAAQALALSSLVRIAPNAPTSATSHG